MDKDHYYMGLAIEEAKEASLAGEVPVGAVIVRDGEVVSKGRNSVEAGKDATCHAEILAIRAASSASGSWRLSGATLYVTLEPCTMCAGAAVLARIERIVFGCPDPKSGALGSLYNIAEEKRLNHTSNVESGLRSAECGDMLKGFFKDLRDKRDKT